PWVTPTDIDSLTISDTPQKLSKKGEKVARVVPANTILCTCIASIGKNTLLTVKGSFNQQINALIPTKDNNAYFLLTASEIWSNTMKSMAATGTMQIINKSEFSKLKTQIPILAEQCKIGEHFKTLDTLITLQQRKCDQLQTLKKYMLQNLFV
ncbi:restriction endonuclease subunit S, partial [uncultured Megasphaera sp.]|uniref:restriction endonuclease subunit S n=1 Tax=uncultured Megasphaera sp. TaxID=165188 RepID=UPI00265827CF